MKDEERVAMLRYLTVLILGLSLAGCVVTQPRTVLHQPISARPAPASPPPPVHGAIFRASYDDRLLFEDRRAQRVGDVLTIVITEKTNASKKSNTNTARASNNTFGVTALQGLPGK